MPDLLDVYDPEFERQQLDNLMFSRYGGMLRSVHGLITRAFNLDKAPLDDVSLRHILLEARARTVAVEAQTQFSIAATLAEGTRLGLTPHEIAYGTADGSFKGIEGLFTKTWASRPETIARTELQNAMLKANVDRFRMTRAVEGLIAHDGDHDAACMARDGKRYELSNPPQLLHPRCTLTVSPILNTAINRNPAAEVAA